MPLPCQPVVKIRLGVGASFGPVLQLGDPVHGKLGENVLGTTAVQVVDVTSTTQRISIRHGRDRVFEESLPGTAFVQFLDTTGDWNPANTSSPYYGQVKPMRQIQIQTEYDGTGYYLFSGYITSWDYTWQDQSVDYATVTVQAVDGFRLLQLANIDNVTGAANKDLPGERIDQILDELDWPSIQRDIYLGDTELQNDPGGIRSGLSALQLIAASDLGAFFMEHNGNAAYYSRVKLAQLAAAADPYEFTDDGTGIDYQEIDINYDETELYNDVTFTRLSGSPQNVSDAASITEYFRRSLDRSGLMMETNALALARATSVLNYRKEVRLRVDSIGLDLSTDSNRVEPALTLEIGDPIIVTKTMAGGTSLTVRTTIQGHQHDITPGRWTTKFSTAYPLSTAFILGSTEFGILGTNTL